MMRNFVLELQGLNTMRPWQESLEEYLLTAFADRVAGSGPAAKANRRPVAALAKVTAHSPEAR
jgi:hypothetical protein